MYFIVCFVCLITMKKCQTVLVYWGCGYEGGRGINDRLTPPPSPTATPSLHTHPHIPHPHPLILSMKWSFDEMLCRRSAVSTKICRPSAFRRIFLDQQHIYRHSGDDKRDNDSTTSSLTQNNNHLFSAHMSSTLAASSKKLISILLL
jgi:hypothetical protein